MVRSSATAKLPQTNGETFLTEHESNLRDLAAMFAMLGLIACVARSKEADNIVSSSFELADQFMKQRAKENENGTDLR